MSSPASKSRGADAAAAGNRLGRYVLVANPTAGRGRGKQALETVESALRAAGVPLDVRTTAAAGDASRFAAEARREEAGVVVAVGGDGTLHEVLNGLLGAPGERQPVLGVVPVGTGNDYAKMLGIPGRDPAEAARILLEGKARTVDVGRIDGGDQGSEFFCNNIGIAFMATANKAHEEHRFLPGRLSYVLGGFRAFLTYKADLLTVSVDGISIQGRFDVVHIGLGKFCGGGICLTPEAQLDNGRLDVCLVANRSKIRGFLEWGKMANGERLEDMTVLSGSRIRVMGPRDFLIHADGEVRRVPTGVLEVGLRVGGLRVIHRA